MTNLDLLKTGIQEQNWDMVIDAYCKISGDKPPIITAPVSQDSSNQLRQKMAEIFFSLARTALGDEENKQHDEAYLTYQETQSNPDEIQQKPIGIPVNNLISNVQYLDDHNIPKDNPSMYTNVQHQKRAPEYINIQCARCPNKFLGHKNMQAEAQTLQRELLCKNCEAARRRK